jgi:hypothetical protein
MKKLTMKANCKNQTKRPNTKAYSSPDPAASAATSVPTIPNVTSDAAPLLIEAVKLQKKYIALEQKLPQDQYNHLMERSGEGRFQKNDNGHTGKRRKTEMSHHDNIQESIFARIDASVKPTGEEMMMQEKKQQLDQVLQPLVQTINKSRRDIHREIIDDGINDDDLAGCAVGCLDFLLGIIQDDKAKIILRHAALCVCRYLLWKRCDCRSVFIRRIKPYVDAIGDADGHLKIRPNIGNERNVVMYQREGLKLIQDLSLEFRFAQPTLVIAARYLEEQKGISMVSSMNTVFKRKTNAGMAELRRIRDIALKFTDQEVSKIHKILCRVDRCFEILVPRFGHDSAFPRCQVTISNEDIADVGINEKEEEVQTMQQSQMINCENDTDEEDNDDDVDWEDGMEHTNANQGKTETTLDGNSEDHLVRVERTLAIMRQSGALSSDGTMNVSFGTLNPLTNGDQSVEQARQLLSKNMNKLLKRQEKIILWMDAIVSADNMTEASRILNTIHNEKRIQSYGGTSSVVLLPEPVRKMKPRILRTLTKCRNAIGVAISTANKIEMKENPKKVKVNDKNQTETQPILSTSWQEAFGVRNEEGRGKSLIRMNSRSSKKPKLSIYIRKS